VNQVRDGITQPTGPGAFVARARRFVFGAGPSSQGSVRDQVEQVLKDLLNLEVNTIIKDHMTGQKMPPIRHALIDIGEEYCGKLREYYSEGDLDRGRLNSSTRGHDPNPDPDSLTDRLGSYAAFDAIQDLIANELTPSTRPGAAPAKPDPNYWMKRRIKDLTRSKASWSPCACGRRHPPTIQSGRISTLAKTLMQSRPVARSVGPC
jgi:hypothetical protein